MEEVARIRAVSSQYSTMLEFAAAGSGAYLSDVHVLVRQLDGKVIFDAVSEGPFLLIDLAPGRYGLMANYGGVEQVQHIQVPSKGHAQARFYWIMSD